MKKLFRFESLESRRLLTISSDVVFSSGISALGVAEHFVPSSALVSATFIEQPSTVSGGAGIHGGSGGSLPIDGKGFGILSTGDAAIAGEPNNTHNAGSSLQGAPVRGSSDFDVTILELELLVPPQTQCLTFDFQFLSEEYSEFLGLSLNDTFIAELDNTDWTTIGSNIIAPGNFATDSSFEPITINSTGFASVNAANASGTTYDGATDVLRASTPITPGTHNLYLSIFDQGDQIYDSAVFLDNLQFRPDSCFAGTSVAPAPAAPATPIPNAFHPEIEITSSGNSAFGAEVTFTAVAVDAEDEDISSGVEWTSSLDGLLGIGASVTKELSQGTHVITALSTDSGGLSRSASLTQHVFLANPNPKIFAGAFDTFTQIDHGSLLNGTINEFKVQLPAQAQSFPLVTTPMMTFELNELAPIGFGFVPVAELDTPYFTAWNPLEKQATFSIPKFFQGLDDGTYQLKFTVDGSMTSIVFAIT